MDFADYEGASFDEQLRMEHELLAAMRRAILTHPREEFRTWLEFCGLEGIPPDTQIYLRRRKGERVNESRFFVRVLGTHYEGFSHLETIIDMVVDGEEEIWDTT